ncbi:transposase [Alkaliphilus pronyensis]
MKCSHCKSLVVIKNGNIKDKQRYRCKECTKTFSDTTLTPFAYSKKAFLSGKNMPIVLLKGIHLEKQL